MENKGLCITCVNDKECTFLRVFPVFECEEFSDSEVKKLKKKLKKSLTNKNFVI